MAQNLRPIKWLEGVLHLKVGDGIKVVGPGDTVSDPVHLATLGAERIQVLIDEGKASFDLHAQPTSPPLTEQEKVDAEAILASSRGEAQGYRAFADAQRARAQAEGTALPERNFHDITAPPAQASRGVGGHGPIVAGTQA